MKYAAVELPLGTRRIFAFHTEENRRRFLLGEGFTTAGEHSRHPIARKGLTHREWLELKREWPNELGGKR